MKSLAYRNNEAAIIAGNPPEKYTRLLPFIEGKRIVEAGSAEGVLSCLLAKQGKLVTAIEGNPERHASAIKLAQNWGVGGIIFANGKLQENFDLLDGKDTFVAVRMVYYLREEIDAVFAEIAKRVPNVVLCGNKGRAKAYHAGNPHPPLGEFNYYASAEGMADLLQRHGYEITRTVTEGDAIVVGKRG